MHSTPKSLFQELRDRNDAAAWERFVKLYWRLLYYWAKRASGPGEDPADLVQDVFAKLVKKLPEFEYDAARGGFRNWLRTVSHRLWQDSREKRANQILQANDVHLDNLAIADANLEQFWNEEYYGLLISSAFKILKDSFDATTQTVFIEVVMNGRPVNDVASELRLTPNAVSTRKFRVLQRLRQALAEFAE